MALVEAAQRVEIDSDCPAGRRVLGVKLERKTLGMEL